MFLVLLIAASDSLTPWNLSSLYGLSILLATANASRRRFWLITATAILLTFLTVPIKIHLHLTQPDVSMLTRMANRSFVGVALLALAALLDLSRLQSERRAQCRTEPANGDAFAALARDEATDGFDQLWQSIIPVLAVLGAIGAVMLIAMTDVASRAYLNPAILYAVPLVLLRWCRSQPVIWWAAAGLLALSVFGALVGPASVIPARPMIILVHRMFVCVVLMTTAWRVTRLIAKDEAQEESPSDRTATARSLHAGGEDIRLPVHG